MVGYIGAHSMLTTLRATKSNWCAMTKARSSRRNHSVESVDITNCYTLGGSSQQSIASLALPLAFLNLTVGAGLDFTSAAEFALHLSGLHERLILALLHSGCRPMHQLEIPGNVRRDGYPRDPSRSGSEATEKVAVEISAARRFPESWEPTREVQSLD